MSINIKSTDWPKIWAAPDNKRLIPKQISIRLPVHVAAKIYALEEIYPSKTRTEIINDLLSTALEEMEDSIPSSKGKEIAVIPAEHAGTEEAVHVYEDNGLRGRYFDVFTRHITAIEKQLGSKNFNVKYESVYHDDELTVQWTSKSSAK